MQAGHRAKDVIVYASGKTGYPGFTRLLILESPGEDLEFWGSNSGNPGCLL